MENTKSERNIVLRDRKTSVFARKKFTVKKNVRSVRNTDTANVPNGLKITEQGRSENPKAKTKSVLHKNNADKSRAKKAAYIKESMERDIAASYAENFDETTQETSTSLADEIAENPKAEKEQFKSRFLGNTSFVNENTHKNSLEDENVRKAYKAKLAEKLMNKRINAEVRAREQTNAVLLSAERAKAAAELSSKADIAVRDNIIPAVDMAAEYVTAMKSGDAAAMIAQPAVSVVKKHLGGTGEAFDNISSAAGTVNSADSVGGTAADVGVNLAAGKVKSALYESAFKPSDERIRERMEKKFYHIDRKDEAKVQRSQEQYKQKLEKQQKEAQRKQQKEIYIKHNKKNPAFAGNAEKKKVAVTSKNSKLLLISSGSAFLVVILIIIILLMIISSIVSWFTPYDYSLAGDESEEPTVEAKTNAEIIDGYALMIQNFMDVTQAYFYLDYGDWYGDVYDYPPPESFLSFSAYFTELQRTIIEEIQAKYEPIFAAAASSEQVMEISQAMSREITAALEAAAVYAREDYLTLMENLDDCMTPDEHRQHYEIHNKGGASGERDSSEFTGKPIISTNHFDDVEFDSELSAEEILSMVALYKSFLSMEQPDEKTEDGETEETEEAFVYNITPQDIMDFFEKTEFITVTTEISENNACSGNCKRILEGDLKSGYYWTYYCDSDHLNLTGVVNPCKTKDELICKIMELTNAEENGIDKEDCEEMAEAYVELIQKELDISEADYRWSGKDDNERAKEFYEMLIDPSRGAIPNNYWTVNTELS